LGPAKHSHCSASLGLHPLTESNYHQHHAAFEPPERKARKAVWAPKSFASIEIFQAVAAFRIFRSPHHPLKLPPGSGLLRGSEAYRRETLKSCETSWPCGRSAPCGPKHRAQHCIRAHPGTRPLNPTCAQSVISVHVIVSLCKTCSWQGWTRSRGTPAQPCQASSLVELNRVLSIMRPCVTVPVTSGWQGWFLPPT